MLPLVVTRVLICQEGGGLRLRGKSEGAEIAEKQRKTGSDGMLDRRMETGRCCVA